MGHAESKFQPANIAVLTVSDTRTEENDTSGRYLVEHAQEAGHNVVDKQIVIDDMYKIRAIVSQWIADDNVQAIMITGGTGFTSRDSTPEALVAQPPAADVLRTLCQRYELNTLLRHLESQHGELLTTDISNFGTRV